MLYVSVQISYPFQVWVDRVSLFQKHAWAEDKHATAVLEFSVKVKSTLNAILSFAAGTDTTTTGERVIEMITELCETWTANREDHLVAPCSVVYFSID